MRVMLILCAILNRCLPYNSIMCACDGYLLNYSVVVGYTEGAQAALSLSGTMLGYYPVKVLPSKTAIAPVNPTFLPRVRMLCCMAIESCQVSYNRPLCVSLILFILLINCYFGF